MPEILLHGIKWEIINQIAFEEINQEGRVEIYLLAKRKEERCRVRVGVIQINMGVLGAYSIKDILIRLGFRRVGVIGISKHHPTKIRVKCPYCQTIQKIEQEWQKCEKCNKRFYLFDDKW